MARPRRSYSKEFKQDVVNLVLEEGRGIGEVSRELDLTETAVRRWVDQAKVDRGLEKSEKLTSDERAELRKLRAENRRLRMEREILKKATAFFAKESK